MPVPSELSPRRTDDPWFLVNPARDEAFRTSDPPKAPLEFHRRLPAYTPTRLVALDDLAAKWGLEHLWLKDESYRLGVPSFKILGASWATYRALCERLGEEPQGWSTVEELADAVRALRPLTLVAATDGNHGRGLARVAKWLNLSARIWVPQSIPPGRLAGIRAEGAEAVIVDGSFDDAVEACTNSRDDRTLMVQDTAVAASEIIPRWICEGYATLFWEVEEQLAELDEWPDVVLVQIGVGSLAAAAAAHFRRDRLGSIPDLVGVEPMSAACVYESARAGRLATSNRPFASMMYCLNAGTPSVTSLPTLLRAFDAFAAISDRCVPDCMLTLARAGVLSGTTGVAGFAGLAEIHSHLRHSQAKVLVLNTEGASDPKGYASVLLAAGEGTQRAQMPTMRVKRVQRGCGELT